MEENFYRYTQMESCFILKCHHAFKYQINSLWKIINNLINLGKFLNEWMEIINYKDYIKNAPHKNEHIFKLGSKFTFIWKNFIRCEAEVIKIIDDDFIKTIKFQAIADTPRRLSWEISYTLLWNSVEENTLLIHEIICNNSNNFYKNEQEFNKKERLIMFMKIEELLMNDIPSLKQEEAIVINVEAEKIWEIIINWKLFRNYVPELCQDVEYFGDPYKIGTHFKIFNPEKNVHSFLKILEYDGPYEEPCKNNKSIFDNVNHFDQLNLNGSNENITSSQCIKFENFNKKMIRSNVSLDCPKLLQTNKLSFEKYGEKNINPLYKKPKSYKVLDNLGQNFKYNNKISGFKTNKKKKINQELKYVLECYDGKPKCPLQLLIFRIVNISDKKCYFSFTHQFKQFVKSELLKSIGNEKKTILINLKNSFEDMSISQINPK